MMSIVMVARRDPPMLLRSAELPLTEINHKHVTMSPQLQQGIAWLLITRLATLRAMAQPIAPLARGARTCMQLVGVVRA